MSKGIKVGDLFDLADRAISQPILPPRMYCVTFNIVDHAFAVNKLDKELETSMAAAMRRSAYTKRIVMVDTKWKCEEFVNHQAILIEADAV